MSVIHRCRPALAAVIVLAASLPVAQHEPRKPALPPKHPSIATSIYEARLRKLHLVRPDLINYPFAFDVIC